MFLQGAQSRADSCRSDVGAPESATTEPRRRDDGTATLPRGGRDDPAGEALRAATLRRRGKGCLTCRLATDHAPLLRELHRLHFVDRLGARELRPWLAEKLRGVTARVPHARSLSRHLSLHADPTAFDVAFATGGGGHHAECSEGQQLGALLGRLQYRLQALDRDPSALLGADGRLDPRKTTALVGLVNATRHAIEAQGKTRQRDLHQFKEIQGCIADFSTRTLDEVMPSLSSVLQTAKVTPGASVVASELERAIRGHAVIYVRNAETVLSDVMTRNGWSS